MIDPYNRQFFTVPRTNKAIPVIVYGTNFWMTSDQIAEMYQVALEKIQEDIDRHFQEGGWDQSTTTKKIALSGNNPKTHYNTDIIFSVGVRFNKTIGKTFLLWTQEYIDKEFHKMNRLTPEQREAQAQFITFEALFQDYDEDMAIQYGLSLWKENPNQTPIKTVEANFVNTFSNLMQIYASDYQPGTVEQCGSKLWNKLHRFISNSTPERIKAVCEEIKSEIPKEFYTIH